jgi:hypothetical protein
MAPSCRKAGIPASRKKGTVDTFLQAGGLPLFFGVTDLIVIGFVLTDTVGKRRLHRVPRGSRGGGGLPGPSRPLSLEVAQRMLV